MTHHTPHIHETRRPGNDGHKTLCREVLHDIILPFHLSLSHITTYHMTSPHHHTTSPHITPHHITNHTSNDANRSRRTIHVK